MMSSASRLKNLLLRSLLGRQRQNKVSEDYVRMAYAVLLRREIDSSGLAAWRDVIASGRFHQQEVIDSIQQSTEYQTKFGVDLFKVMHRSRQEWIKTVPSARRVLDIGGSSANSAEGALIELGYPHRPEHLHILDLPPERQYWGKPKYDQGVTHHFDWGEVHFFHPGAEGVRNVEKLQDQVYDMVFLGQAIEHIYPSALPDILAWIRDHLAPDGRLVFDTPNRLLTIIQCPHSLIDPDHKYEYAPNELARIVEDAGFVVTKKVGMVHLPVQATSGIYDALEFSKAQSLSPDADACYLFAIEAKLAGVAKARDELDRCPQFHSYQKSRACTQAQVESDVFKDWARRLGDQPGLLHRKLWEWCFITRVLDERCLLAKDSRGLGFAVGREPLPSLFASLGCSITATDLGIDQAMKEGWVDGNQHAGGVSHLNDRGLCAMDVLARNVQFRAIDMKAIPSDLGGFDFLWSSCAMEHLGSLADGAGFVIEAMKCLRPGGVAVHTTELNCESNDNTIEAGHSVIYRRRDLESLAHGLRALGHVVQPFDFNLGDGPADRIVDEEPFGRGPHLKLRIGAFASTSFGIIITAKTG